MNWEWEDRDSANTCKNYCDKIRSKLPGNSSDSLASRCINFKHNPQSITQWMYCWIVFFFFSKYWFISYFDGCYMVHKLWCHVYSLQSKDDKRWLMAFSSLSKLLVSWLYIFFWRIDALEIHSTAFVFTLRPNFCCYK